MMSTLKYVNPRALLSSLKTNKEPNDQCEKPRPSTLRVPPREGVSQVRYVVRSKRVDIKHKHNGLFLIVGHVQATAGAAIREKEPPGVPVRARAPKAVLRACYGRAGTQ